MKLVRIRPTFLRNEPSAASASADGWSKPHPYSGVCDKHQFVPLLRETADQQKNPNPSSTGKNGFGLYWSGAGNRTRTCTLTQWNLNPPSLPIPPCPLMIPADGFPAIRCHFITGWRACQPGDFSGSRAARAEISLIFFLMAEAPGLFRLARQNAGNPGCPGRSKDERLLTVPG